MLEKKYDAIVIGGGAAGMSAALSLYKKGHTVALLERDEFLGGILLQCIHNGFGLHHFKEELTGPEYAARLSEEVEKSEIDVYLNTTVMDIHHDNEIKSIFAYSKSSDVLQLSCSALILAMGCRERNRGNIGTPGSRPSGVFTAGLAQRLLNVNGYIPGKNVVIVGSGDIGLIMARRLSWVGCKVLAVVEIMPYPSGISRNIVQCLQDFDIPLYLSHSVTNIYGKDRINKIEVTPLVGGLADFSRSFEIECDTILLSVGLVPENELSQNAGVEIYHDTNGPYVDAKLMTNLPGVFACGNVLHVHDLVDFVSEEADRCGEYASEYLKKTDAKKQQFRVKAGSNIKYVLPNRYIVDGENNFYMRALIVKNDATLTVRINNEIVKTEKLRHVQPSEMISLKLKPDDLANISTIDDNILEISIQ